MLESIDSRIKSKNNLKYFSSLRLSRPSSLPSEPLQHLEQAFTFKDYSLSICDALCDLMSFLQNKKRKKHPWRSDTFSLVKL